jgi:hypothetical protein
MSHQIGAVISPAGRSGHDKNNRLARQLARPFVGMGGLGFVFWLAQHEQDCVTI